MHIFRQPVFWTKLFWRFPCFFLLTGCSGRSAPSFPIVGAYFPSWLFCAAAGVISALFFRVLFLKIGIDHEITDRFILYVALGTIIGLLLWIVFFGK